MIPALIPSAVEGKSRLVTDFFIFFFCEQTPNSLRLSVSLGSAVGKIGNEIKKLNSSRLNCVIGV